MKYHIIPVTAFQQNCTLLWCEQTREAAVVDPGGESAKILREIAARDLTVTQILLTHGHIDHVGAAARLAQTLSVPIYGPQQEDQYWLEQLSQQADMFGFTDCQPFMPTRWLQQGDELTVGEERLAVLHCPGHTPGHVVYFCEQARLAQVGDVLFRGSIGRSDFAGGNHQDLINSIWTRLFTLGDDVAFIPGHGPMSTIGEERRSNPYVRDEPENW
ncbi:MULTISPECIES: MBL fold metallo-hydrolase [Edwardsiella]|uniref:MBL fold metallo-hydrolase n=1 Tax=Edwardsiella TaxID=635 RepID=UPI000BE26F41|nr:MBL fold metallo-hydrolase [Edwardsiella tarda]ATI65345.1 hypothetical protein CPU03_14360 [Edwardsiella tarda]